MKESGWRGLKTNNRSICQTEHQASIEQETIYRHILPSIENSDRSRRGSPHCYLKGRWTDLEIRGDIILTFITPRYNPSCVMFIIRRLERLAEVFQEMLSLDLVQNTIFICRKWMKWEWILQIVESIPLDASSSNFPLRTLALIWETHFIWFASSRKNFPMPGMRAQRTLSTTYPCHNSARAPPTLVRQYGSHSPPSVCKGFAPWLKASQKEC